MQLAISKHKILGHARLMLLQPVVEASVCVRKATATELSCLIADLSLDLDVRL